LTLRNGYFAGNTKAVQERIKKRLLDNKKIMGVVFEASELVKNTAVENIARGAKSGRTYVKYNPRRTHTASAEGQAPATDTGNLIKGISTEIVKKGKTIEGIVKANAKSENGANYAKFLEFGTVDMRPRPFLFPALEENRRKIITMFAKKGINIR
tara:strand:- start:8835 stop:9299 length:465 start_codon:yes stop_codon:yes gene_type:complete